MLKLEIMKIKSLFLACLFILGINAFAQKKDGKDNGKSDKPEKGKKEVRYN
jgi:hypothetical protein